MLADPFPQGRFNERAKHGSKETKNDYIISSEGLDKMRQEESLPNPAIDESRVGRRTMQK
jgi:hypothetical protein